MSERMDDHQRAGTSEPDEAARPATPTLAMVLTLGLVSAFCGLAIVSAYEGTLPAVKNNKRIAIERAVFKVIPKASKVVVYDALPGSIAPAAGEDAPKDAVRFYAAYDEAGDFAGIAAEGVANGYAGPVRVMFAYSPECQCINGFGVVAMNETPGIGDKILKEKHFLANFKALDVRLKQDMTALANEVETVKQGSKTQPWQVDAIAGATVTSRAVGKGINDAAKALLPRLFPNIEQIRSQKP
ncbi:MAG: electron transport complex protein RnfG [Betaproteobacteria bacterium ADurb.Bin341]|nr:MAG: electron transport complex protein RnfG [Betaproteobacteria bacterium ADurb.Bin341]